MTSAPLAQDRTSLPRLWPIDLQVYDRAPFLRADEQEALDIIVERNHGIYSERWTSAAKGAIQRLLHPIADILMAIGSKGPRPTNVTSFLLEQMHHQQTTFWAWQQQDWVTLLGPNNKAFDEHFPNGQDYRQHLLAFGYLTEGITDLTAFGVVLPISLATKVFGSTCVEDAIHQVQSELLSWGHGASRTITYIPNVLAIALLTNRSPRLEDLTIDCLERCLQEHLTNSMRHGAPMLSRALVSLGILARPLRPRSRKSEQIGQQETLATIPAEWSEVCQRWFATTTLAPATRQTNYYQLLKIGRWLACTHPDQAAPAQWTREIAAECVAAVDRMSVGQWVSDKSTYKACGKPISPRTKDGILGALRVFFFDCQE